MPAHFVVLGAAQWALGWLAWYPLVSLAGLSAAALLLALSTRTAGIGLWGPFAARANRRGAALAVHTSQSDLRALAAAIQSSQLPCAVFVTPEQAADEQSVTALLQAGCEVGLHFAPAQLRQLTSRAEARARLQTGMQALAASRVRPLVVLAPRSRSGPGLWPALVELACLGLRPAIAWPVSPRAIGDGTIVELALGDDAASDWKALAGALRQVSVPWRPLSDVLRCPVMADASSGPSHAAELFYDAQAGSYDDEQQGHGQSGLRAVEQALVQRELIDALSGKERVLELGAGTGRFTSLLAARGCKVVATDASRQMLRVLERKATREGWSQVQAVHGELAGEWPAGPFDLVCSFSAVEYVEALGAVLGNAAQRLAPGGKLYFTTAHAGPFRLFTQVGNAMRQGVWLHARTVSEVRQGLAQAGFERIRITTHGLRLPIVGGMLLAAQATKA